MYIQLADDYERKDNKGLYAYFSYDENETGQEENDIILFRIEDGEINLYESQNPEFIALSRANYMTKENVKLVCDFLQKQYPNAVIDIDPKVLARKFIITYEITGALTIEAETMEQAREIFEKIPEFELYENASPSEITGIFYEDPSLWD